MKSAFVSLLLFSVGIGFFSSNAKAEQVWLCATKQLSGGGCAASCQTGDTEHACAGTGTCSTNSNNGSVKCTGRVLHNNNKVKKQ